ncbi:MAG: hypothetical protein Kow00106_17700 [Anaerolineae bacterium]
MLRPNAHEIEGLRQAFEAYASGAYSDNDVARLLNEKGFVSKTGKPFSTETVRDLLQNRTYLGYVKYQAYARHADGSRSFEAPVEWFKGKHDAVIDQDLFDKCQAVRKAKAVHHEYYPKYRVYLLRDLAFCADCVAHMPADTHDDDFGKMRAHTNFEGTYRYYRCRARDFGRDCPQTSVRADTVEAQVVDILKHLKPPADWRKRMVGAMGQFLGDQKLDERIAEIKDVIARMDFRWDHGFVTDQDRYLEERVRLQQELEQLVPMGDDDLERAADLLQNFRAHWERTGGDLKQQEALVKLIVARVWIKGERVVALSLRPDYHVTLGLENAKPTEITVGSDENRIVHRRERRGSSTSVYTARPIRATPCRSRLFPPHERMTEPAVWSA